MNSFVCFKTEYYTIWFSSWGCSQPQPGEDYLSVVCKDCASGQQKWLQKEHIVLHISEMGVVRDIHEVYCFLCNKCLFEIQNTDLCYKCKDHIKSSEFPQYSIIETYSEESKPSPFDEPLPLSSTI
jgi:hypothetical protein